MATNNGHVKSITTRTLDATAVQLARRFGAGALMRLGDKATSLATRSISTGFPALDLALGVGGLPRGRIVDIYGPESSGKTTLCQRIIAEAQREGGVVVFIDMEHALDPSWVTRCGVNIDDLYIAQPHCGEEALEIAEAVIRAGVDVVVIDSTAALVPRAEIEGDMGDRFGHHGAIMSQALRKLAGPVRKNDTLLIFTSQLRTKQEVMFGSPETTTGGMALRFYASVRLDIRRIQAVKDRGDVIGNRVRVTVKKNKVAPPFRQAEFEIRW